MRLSILTLLLAGLGLAQDKPTTGTTKHVIKGAGSSNLLISYSDPSSPKLEVAGTTDLVYRNPSVTTDQSFYMQADGLPHVIVIVNRKGEPLVRCVAETQACALITPKENQ